MDPEIIDILNKIYILLINFFGFFKGVFYIVIIFVISYFLGKFIYNLIW